MRWININIGYIETWIPGYIFYTSTSININIGYIETI